MPGKKLYVLPKLQRYMAALGENIRLARLRRRFSAQMVADRAGISRNTLRNLEKGETGVSFGAMAQVLFVLGLSEDLTQVGLDDSLGRKLQDLNLPVRARAPKRKPL